MYFLTQIPQWLAIVLKLKLLFSLGSGLACSASCLARLQLLSPVLGILPHSDSCSDRSSALGAFTHALASAWTTDPFGLAASSAFLRSWI